MGKRKSAIAEKRMKESARIADVYVIFDLEWNLLPYTDPNVYRKANMDFSGEIIQIGAVKCDARGTILDTFNGYVMPQFIPKLYSRVEELTRITEEQLLNEGVSFPLLWERFKTWCGEHPVLLSWGVDDIRILDENIHLYQLSNQWEYTWYDAQKVYGLSPLCTSKGGSVERACTELGIPILYPLHNAYNDAVLTSQILSRISYEDVIKKGYKELKVTPPFIKLGRPIDFSLWGLYASKEQAFHHTRMVQVQCPYCKKHIRTTQIEKVSGKRYMAIATCPVHNQFVVFWKVHKMEVKAESAPHVLISKSIMMPKKSLVEWYETAKQKSQKRRMAYEERRRHQRKV